jgi:uncharacterized membrane protein
MAADESRQYDSLNGTASQNGNKERLVNGLGWFSIGLGVAEIAAPGKIAKLIGLRDKERSRTLLRIYGFREIAAGIGILSQTRQSGWLWGRVAGDVVDLASLGSAFAAKDADRARVASTAAAVLGVTALDVLCAQGFNRISAEEGTAQEHTARVAKTIVIGRSPEEVYGFWHDFSNLPSFMKHLESVQVLGDKRSHWRMQTAAGKIVEWDAELVDDEPNQRISWRSLDGSDVNHSGSVRFERAPGGRGTLVKVELQYSPPGGVIAANIAKLFRAEPGQQIEEDLRALKQVMETGEIAKSDASIHRGMHPARPRVKVATA